MELYGCSFQDPSCLTWTWTGGNAAVTHFFVEHPHVKALQW